MSIYEKQVINDNEIYIWNSQEVNIDQDIWYRNTSHIPDYVQ
jgi:hypothetical protein